MMGRIDTAAILAHIDIVELINGYVPLTKNGTEFEACCPFHTEKTPSFKVSQTKQLYHCFGCGANGDAIGFLQQYKGLSFLDACKELGGDGAVAPGNAPAQRQPVKAKEPSPWVPLPVAASDAPPAHLAHVVRGAPERVWCYRNAADEVIGYVYRFKTSDGGKEVLPLSWCKNTTTGQSEWRWMAFGEPRPLYGLDALAARPGDVVLVVEGEKCKDVAAQELPELVAASWPGGGKAVGKVDWSPLYGRKVVLWPDCDAKRVPLTKTEREGLSVDEAVAAQSAKPFLAAEDQPGIKAMRQIADELLAHGSQVWMMQIPGPGEKPDGWDIADAAAEGLALAQYIRDSSRLLRAEPPVDAEGMPPEPPDFEADWRDNLVRNKDGRISNVSLNVRLIVESDPRWMGLLGYCQFSYRIMKLRPPPWKGALAGEWTDVDSAALRHWLTEFYGFEPPKQSIDDAVIAVAHGNGFHPVRGYLGALRWDGVPRLDNWLIDYVGADPEGDERKQAYLRAVGAMWMIAAVCRVMRPPVKMDCMLILEGQQGAGKSTVFSILGGSWFTDSAFVIGSTDGYQFLRGAWIVEMAELDALSKADATKAKQFMSGQEDRYRSPYGRYVETWARQCVFAGSTNQDHYFKDSTGNRRYWPVRIGERVDTKALRRDRDQLWAEATHRYSRGDPWWPSDDLADVFRDEQEARYLDDAWQPLVAGWLDFPENAHLPRFTLPEIMAGALKLDPAHMKPPEQMRVGAIMAKLGWARKRFRDGNARAYGYFRPEGRVNAF